MVETRLAASSLRAATVVCYGDDANRVSTYRFRMLAKHHPVTLVGDQEPSCV
jgi:hypothetical protein